MPIGTFYEVIAIVLQCLVISESFQAALVVYNSYSVYKVELCLNHGLILIIERCLCEKELNTHFWVVGMPNW